MVRPSASSWLALWRTSITLKDSTAEERLEAVCDDMVVFYCVADVSVGGGEEKRRRERGIRGGSFLLHIGGNFTNLISSYLSVFSERF